VGQHIVIPSAARHLAREWLEPFPRKIPRYARDDGRYLEG
jgi:hypothetical protein